MNTRQDIYLGDRGQGEPAFTSKQEVLACSTSVTPLFKHVSSSKNKTPVFVIPLNPFRTKEFGVACYRKFWESINLSGTAGFLFRARVASRWQHDSITYHGFLDNSLFLSMQVLLSLNHSCICKEKGQLSVYSLKSQCHQLRFPLLGSSCINSVPSRDLSRPACRLRQTMLYVFRGTLLQEFRAKQHYAPTAAKTTSLSPRLGHKHMLKHAPNLLNSTYDTKTKNSSEFSP